MRPITWRTTNWCSQDWKRLAPENQPSWKMALLRGWPSAATSIAVQAALNAAEEIHEVLAAALGDGALDNDTACDAVSDSHQPQVCSMSIVLTVC